MTCRVIKTIKGRRYIYEQTSYRVGQKVVTKTKYIGAASGDYVANHTPSPASEFVQSETITKVVNIVDNAPVHNEIKELTLQNSYGFEIQSISSGAVDSQQSNFESLLRKNGYSQLGIPKLTISPGSKSEIKKGILGKSYTITLPKEKTRGARASFWQNYHKVQGFQYLDSIKKTNPDKFKKLENDLCECYSKQNKAIRTYIARTQRDGVFGVGLTLHFIYSKMVSAWTQRKLSPEEIGLSDYSSRKTWKDDTVILMAEIHKEGWENCYSKYSDELKKAETKQLRLVKQYKKMKFNDWLKGKKYKNQTEWRATRAKREAIFQACNKLSILAEYYEPSKQFMAFDHVASWKKKRERWLSRL